MSSKFRKFVNSVVSLAVVIAVFVGNTSFTSFSLDGNFVITDYGARADSATQNTGAIQSAIDDCSRKGGGTVVIPSGTFISGSVFFKKGVNLFIEKGGVLKGSVNQEDYLQVNTRWEGTEMKWTAALLNAFDLEGINLSGEGMIDGSGEVWTARGIELRKLNQDGAKRVGRPRLIAFQNCRDVTISGLTLKNQASWGLFVLYSKNVKISDLTIRAEHNIPSSDGIDIDSSDGVLVTGCNIDVNDDCISIKSGKDEDGLRVNRPCENIVIEKTHFAYGHGGVAMGSETSGGIRNVEVRNCTAGADNWAPIRFKSQPSRGGVVENIVYRNFKLNNTRKAVEFNMAWRMVPPLKPAAKVLPVVRNVKLINITGTVKSIGDIRGLEGSPIENVSFSKCKLKAKRGLVMENAKNVDLSGLKFSVEEGERVVKKNVE